MKGQPGQEVSFLKEWLVSSPFDMELPPYAPFLDPNAGACQRRVGVKAGVAASGEP